MSSRSINSSFPTDTLLFLDQCALNPDGSFKDASEITWHHDPDDETPIASGSKPTGSSHTAFIINFLFLAQIGFGVNVTWTKWPKSSMQNETQTTRTTQSHHESARERPNKKQINLTRMMLILRVPQATVTLYLKTMTQIVQR